MPNGQAKCRAEWPGQVPARVGRRRGWPACTRRQGTGAGRAAAHLRGSAALRRVMLRMADACRLLDVNDEALPGEGRGGVGRGLGGGGRHVTHVPAGEQE